MFSEKGSWFAYLSTGNRPEKSGYTKTDNLRKKRNSFIHYRSVSKFSTLEEEDDFTEILNAPNITASTEQIVVPCTPEFTKVKVQEFFHKLVSCGVGEFDNLLVLLTADLMARD